MAAKTYKGKNKTEICYEAFMELRTKLGRRPTFPEVDNYTQNNYGIPCKQYLYFETLAAVKGDTRNPETEARFAKAKRTYQANTPNTDTKRIKKYDRIRKLFADRPELLKAKISQVVDAMKECGIHCHVKAVYDIRQEILTGKNQYHRRKARSATTANTAPAPTEEAKQKPSPTPVSVPPPAPTKQAKQEPSLAGVSFDEAKTVKSLCDTIGLGFLKELYSVIESLGNYKFGKALEIVEIFQVTPPPVTNSTNN